MLEILTGGEYKATPHRVLNVSTSSRMSVPFFFDPPFDAIMEPGNCTIIPYSTTFKSEEKPASMPASNVSSEWNKPFRYGDYIYDKVCSCFPILAEAV